MTRQQAEILERTGRVCLADNGHGFMVSVIDERRSVARRSDPTDDGDDPDDRSTSAVESVQQREARLAEGRRLAASIQAKFEKDDVERIAELDRMSGRFENFEARRLIAMARENGFHFDLIMQECCALEREEKKILNLLKEYRRTSLGLPSASNASRAAGFLNDPDPDVRMYARTVSNRELLPGEKLDEEKAEPSSTKKTKRGDRSGDKKDLEEAEAGKIDKPGQTDGDDIDAEMDKFYKSRGWK